MSGINDFMHRINRRVSIGLASIMIGAFALFAPVGGARAYGGSNAVILTKEQTQVINQIVDGKLDAQTHKDIVDRDAVDNTYNDGATVNDNDTNALTDDASTLADDVDATVNTDNDNITDGVDSSDVDAVSDNTVNIDTANYGGATNFSDETDSVLGQDVLVQGKDTDYNVYNSDEITSDVSEQDVQVKSKDAGVFTATDSESGASIQAKVQKTKIVNKNPAKNVKNTASKIAPKKQVKNVVKKKSTKIVTKVRKAKKVKKTTKKNVLNLYDKLSIPTKIGNKNLSKSQRTKIFQGAVLDAAKDNKKLDVLKDYKPVDGIIGKNTKKAARIISNKNNEKVFESMKAEVKKIVNEQAKVKNVVKKKSTKIVKKVRKAKAKITTIKDVLNLYDKLGIPKKIGGKNLSQSKRTMIFQRAVLDAAKDNKKLQHVLINRKPVDGVIGGYTKNADMIILSKDNKEVFESMKAEVKKIVKEQAKVKKKNVKVQKTKKTNKKQLKVNQQPNKKQAVKKSKNQKPNKVHKKIVSTKTLINSANKKLKKEFNEYNKKLKKGQKKIHFEDFVKMKQEYLKTFYRGTYVKVNGIVDTRTAHAIEDLQKVGVKRAKNGELMILRVKRALDKNGWDSDKLKEYQGELKELGYYNVKPTGNVDMATITVTIRYQLLHNYSVMGTNEKDKKLYISESDYKKILYVDGVPGDKTLSAMKEDIKKMKTLKLVNKVKDKKGNEKTVLDVSRMDVKKAKKEGTMSRLGALVQWGLGIVNNTNNPKDNRVISNTVVSKHEEKVMVNKYVKNDEKDHAKDLIKESRRVFSSIKNSYYSIILEADMKYNREHKGQQKSKKNKQKQ